MKEEKTSGAGRSHFAGVKMIEQQGKGNLVHNLFGQKKNLCFRVRYVTTIFHQEKEI